MNRSKLISLFVVSVTVILLISLTSGKVKPNFTLNGRIIGKQSGNIVLTHYIKNIEIRDTAKIVNGRFCFTGIIKEPTYARLEFCSREIWLEPTVMNITINVTNQDKFVMTGSKTQLEQDDIDRKCNIVYKQMDVLSKMTQKYSNEFDSCTDTVKQAILSKQVDSLSNLFYNEKGKITHIREQFIRAHPNSYVSASLLCMLNINEEINLETSKELYNKLGQSEINQNGNLMINVSKELNIKSTPDVRKSNSAVFLKNNIDKMDKNRIGCIAPDFEAKDEKHNTMVRLSDFKGKVILMDFWAYWCGPCRKGFPYVKDLYSRYHEQGFEVIAVNTDMRMNLPEWRKAIEKDSISMWHHVQAAEQFNLAIISEKDIYYHYFVQAIPRKIIIDKKGIIRGNWCGFSDRVENEIKVLVEKLMAE